MKIKKAIIPIAGKGTRFLPATKQIPKEMLPILKKPMVHYVVEEAVESGIEQIVFVTSYGKESIENYFDRNFELEQFLEKNKKFKELELIQNIGKMFEIITVRQKEQLGLGHAVLTAKSLIKDENFAVLLGDDLILNDVPATKQLIDVSHRNNNKAVIGVMEVKREDTYKYGIVAGSKIEDRLTLMTDMVEKPKPELAPTTLATPGRYILPSSIFEILEKIPRGAGGEYQLTDAIKELALSDKVYAYEFFGDRFDTGSVEGHFNATLEFALRDNELAPIAKKIIEEKYLRIKNG